MISKSIRGAFKQRQALVNLQARAMGGGEKKPAMPASETNFDIVVVGKYNILLFLIYVTYIFIGGANATALTKFLQTDDLPHKMALVCNQGKFVLPQAYFGVSHYHVAPLKLESQSVSA